ncbi:MAG: DUF6468 domain-containing protein [Pseudomonadota bacterium]
MQIVLSYAADILLMTASLGAAAYCMILSRRLSRLGSFDKGIGSAIAVMSAQVEEMKAALGAAKAGSDGAGQHLGDLIRQAREISAELEMMIAACHDFAETAIDVQSRTGVDAEAREQAADRVMSQPSGMAPEEPSVSQADRERQDDEPVFGSRRGRMIEADSPAAEDPVAVFRHRKATEA